MQSWEMEVIADVTANWKTIEVPGRSSNASKNTMNACLKRWETHQIFSGVLLCTDTVTQI